jgi:hypothetical protein
MGAENKLSQWLLVIDIELPSLNKLFISVEYHVSGSTDFLGIGECWQQKY